MKVIAIDNFGRDYVSDVLIGENLSELDANLLASDKNQEYGDSDNAPYYYKVVEDDYKLHDAIKSY